jgi:hypothetical protein
MKLLYLLFLININASVFSQGFIDKTKSQVREELQKFALKNRIKAIYNEYDSLITFDIRDSTRKKADFIYVFDKSGKCNTEIKIACNDCIRKFLKDNLKSIKYKWIAQNDSVYNSNWAGGLKMERFKKDTLYFLRIMKDE